MRITAELLQQGAEQRTNTLQERELVLRGYGIVVLENLSAMAATTTTGGAGATATDRVVTTTTTTTMNAGYDALDLSNNRITELGNFPRLPRVTALYCSHNQIGANQLDANNKNNNKNNNNKPSSSSLLYLSSSSSSTSSCIFTNNIQCNLPNLTTLTLCFNRIASLTIVSQLAQACPNLVFLSLRGNPVTYKTHYRWFTLHEFDRNNKKNNNKNNNNTQGPQNSVPTTTTTSKKNPFQLQSQQQVVDQLLLLRVLDYRRIRPMERKQAQKWSQSSTGATILAEFSLSTTTQEEDNNNNNRNGTNSQTFVPGELLPNDDNDDDDKKKKNNADATIVQTLTNEQKDILRQLLQNAQNENEIQTIQHAILHQGMLPETYYQWQKQQQQEQQEQEQQQATPLQEQSLRTTTTTTTMTTTLSGTKRKVPEDQ